MTPPKGVATPSAGRRAKSRPLPVLQEPPEQGVIRRFEPRLRWEPERAEQLLLSAPEVAQVLSISASKAYELMEAGLLPIVRIGTRRLVPLPALRRWVEERTEPWVGQGQPKGAEEPWPPR